MCALPSDQVDEALDYLGCQADVLSLDPYSLDEVLATILAVGRGPACAGRGRALVDGLRARLADGRPAVAGRPRPRVAVVEWVDPPFTAGHWVPDLVRAAGGEPVAAAARRPRPWPRPGPRSPPRSRTWCGRRRAASTSTARPIRPGRGRRAARRPPVWAIDADGIVVRPGPRLVDGVEAIAAILHPGVVPGAPPPQSVRLVTSAR